MRIHEIRTEAEFEALGSDWNQLLATSASDSIFLTWEWLSAWWAAYGNPGDLQVLLAFDEDRILRGIAPLRRRTEKRYGRTYHLLAFIGDGSCDSDYLDFITATGFEERVIEAFVRHLEPQVSGGTLLELNEIPAEARSLPVLEALGSCDGMVSRVSSVPCATVRLPGTWDAYLRMLSPRFRTKVRSVTRNLETRDDVRCRFCVQQDEVRSLLPSLFELHTRRWAKEGKPGVFGWDRKRTFYSTLSTSLLEKGWLRFSSLEWHGKVLACQYGFAYGNRYYQLQEGYEPASEHWNVGIALRAWSIREFLNDRISEYDFLGGIGRHKSDWGAETKLSRRIVVGRALSANVLFCRGPEWGSKTRERVKAHLPSEVLAWREARVQHHRLRQIAAATNETSPAVSVPASVRRALASCYFHSPLLRASRFLRDRYELRTIPNGHVPRLRVQPRQTPTLRILYFHRVNDDGDPFFPSMPPTKFEEQMRFVARHYRVVSLREAVARLSSGSPAEPVVAITFDDGYRDNYLNALPVLERYGLPATIFLTTGSLDSREPLWFEKLALAMKKTSEAFVDVEFDIPRRFWMRSEAERLHTGEAIFAYLRTIGDDERRQHLDGILKALKLRDTSERNNQMLTWDEVRLMKRSRIDFGGHTVSHPFVSRVAPEQARWEISECKRRIEEELQESVEHFAYPSGRAQDFAAWNKDAVREAGYRAAVSTLWGVNFPETDRMELRRGNPWEPTLPLFAAKLDWYQWING